MEDKGSTFLIVREKRFSSKFTDKNIGTQGVDKAVKGSRQVGVGWEKPGSLTADTGLRKGGWMGLCCGKGQTAGAVVITDLENRRVGVGKTNRSQVQKPRRSWVSGAEPHCGLIKEVGSGQEAGHQERPRSITWILLRGLWGFLDPTWSCDV